MIVIKENAVSVFVPLSSIVILAIMLIIRIRDFARVQIASVSSILRMEWVMMVLVPRDAFNHLYAVRTVKMLMYIIVSNVKTIQMIHRYFYA